MEIRGGQTSVRVGVDTWVVGAPGALVVDGSTLNPPYSVLAIGDPPIALRPNNKLGPVGDLTAHGFQKTLLDIPFPICHVHYQRCGTVLLDFTR